MRKLFKERKLFKGGNYMRKYGMYFFQETDGNPLGLWQGHWGTTYIWYSECFYHLLWTCVLKVKRRNSIFRNVFKHLAMVQNWTFHFSPSSSCQLYSSCPGWFNAWFLSNVSHSQYQMEDKVVWRPMMKILFIKLLSSRLILVKLLVLPTTI